MNNQIFDWSRFVLALRKEVFENKRLLLLGALGLYGLLVMVMVTGNLMNQSGFDAESPMAAKFVVFVIYFIAAGVIASLMFRQMRTKMGRVEFFTSPSSTLEKFLVNVTVYALGFFVAFIVCAQLADITRWCVMNVLNTQYKDFVIPGLINFANIGHFNYGIDLFETSDLVWIELAIWFGLIANLGVFALGSTIWPRLSFLKTFGVLCAIRMGFNFILLILLPNVDLSVVDTLIGDDPINMVITLAVINLLFSITFWTLAWISFKRKDVVSLKWWK